MCVEVEMSNGILSYFKCKSESTPFKSSLPPSIVQSVLKEVSLLLTINTKIATKRKHQTEKMDAKEVVTALSLPRIKLK